MATQNSEASEGSGTTQPTEGSDAQDKSADVATNTDAHAQTQITSTASETAMGLPHDTVSFRSQSQDGTPNNADLGFSLKNVSSAFEYDQSQAEHGAVISPNSKLVTPMIERDATSSPGFTFPRLDRRALELGIKRKDFRHAAPSDDSSPAKMSPLPEDDVHDMDIKSAINTSPQVAAGQGDHTHGTPTKATAHGSDNASDSHSMSAGPQNHGSVQYQVDEQIYQEASMSDWVEHYSSPVSHSEDLIYVGASRARHPENVLSGSVVAKSRHQTLQPLSDVPNAPNSVSPTASTGSRVNKTSSHGTVAPRYMRRSSAEAMRRRLVPQAQPQARENAAVAIPPPNGVQELLEVVEYKFKQNEQQLRQTFSIHSSNIQRQLQQACEENEELRAQVAALEDRCEGSEAAIVKYKNQLGKAKGLQKFLDGLGSDLHSLKRSYDAEKRSFTERMEASETEILRLESTLAGKDEFEGMLSHSKTSLEKLLEARGFELQSLVQHRDMLRIQLDERIGQLVEERDTRLRLEQLVAELRASERASLTTSIEECAASLTSRFGNLCRQDDQLVIEIAELQQAIKGLTERPYVTSHDCKAIKSEMHDLGLRVVQTLSQEATTDTTVAELSSSVEGIIQSHMQTLSQSLNRLEAASKQTASNASAQAAFRLELQSATDRLKSTESQLEATRKSEASLRKSLDQSTARVSELEAAPALVADTNTSQITSQDVENKINEAVAEARKQLSNSANTFIAQEKSRYSNELKKVESEHRKALERAHLQKEELGKLRAKLDEMQSSAKANTNQGSTQQLKDMVGRFRVLEKKHNAAQLELEHKRSLEASLAALRAERDTARAEMSTHEPKITALMQELERCNTDLLQARGSEDDARAQVEELRSQNQSDVDDLHRKLLQADEKARFAEAGLMQMKSSAEKTILAEQEKHRKQQEALQQRLDEAQSELQMKSEEADENRTFMERTVTQQQAAWQRTNAEVEAKASDYQSKLEDTSRLLQSAQEEQGTLRASIASLEAEIQGHRQSEIEHRSLEDTKQVAIDDLRNQLDVAQTEVSSLQAVQQRYLREKEERSARDAKAKSAFETLRKDHDEAKAVIVGLQVSEKRSKDQQAEREQRDIDEQRELDNVRYERDSAQAALKELRARRDETQIRRPIELEKMPELAPQLKPYERGPDGSFMPPAKPEKPAAPKQRKRADRNTNTIVRSGPGHGRAAAQSTRSDASSSQAQVLIPAQPPSSLMTISPNRDEMLDVVSTQPEKGSESQLISSMQDCQNSHRSHLREHAKSSQPFSASLDFSGNPLIATRESVVEREPAVGVSQASLSSDFKIYEDPQNSLNDGLDEESYVRANFTFRKPFPQPNSGSKRLSRTTSDKSLEAHAASSRGTRRTPENTEGYSTSHANKTPDMSKYPFGSSPEFMNPPSTKTKRRYSGGPTTPANLEPVASRRSSTPLPDPRVVARPSGNKRVAAKDVQPQNDLEPPAKRQTMQSSTKPRSKVPSDDSFLGRSSQSINDLPRIEDLNAARAGSQMQSSHMRTSAGSRRVTRNQKGGRDDAFQARFRQELRRP